MADLPTPVAAAVDTAVERIGDRFRGHDVVLRQMLAHPVSTAYWAGRNDAIREFRTTTDVAGELGITPRHLLKVATDLQIGTRIADVTLFLPEDVDRLRNRPDRRRRRD